jgi:hypothetical protein
MSRREAAVSSDQDRDGRETPPRDAGGRWTPSGRDDGWRQEDRPEQPERPHAPSLARHCGESSLVAVLSVLLAAYLLPASVPMWMPLSALIAVTTVTWYVTFQMTRSRHLSGYMLAWGLLITGWFTLARTDGVHEQVIALLFIPAIVLAFLGVPAISRYREVLAAGDQAARDKAGTAILRHWEQVLEAHGAHGAKVLDVVRHDGSLEIRGRLPRAVPGRTTMTFAQLQALGPEIAVSERRNEDGIYFSKPEDGSAADFVLHVRDRRSGQRAPVHLPVRHVPLSVNRSFGVGVLDSGREYGTLLREKHIQIIGVTRVGKSNLINVFIDRIGGMIDALIWMIDMKGGRTSRPWIVPWLQGLTPRPVIDWMATTREETKIMLDTALLAVQTRAGYPGFEKIIPSRDTPAIILICDDVGRCFGHGVREGGISNYGMSQLGAQFTELAGSEAGVLIGAGQRANVELWGGTAMKSQSELRFGLRATSSADGAQVFPDNAQAARMVAGLRDKGDCLVKDGPDISPVVHLYRVGDADRITKRALWAGDYRPEPERRLIEAMGSAYSERWDRSASLLDEWRRTAGIPEPTEPGGPDDDGDGDDSDPDDWDAKRFEREFGRIVAQVPDAEAPADPRRKVMWRILRDAGWAGLSVKSIVIRLDTAGAMTRRDVVHHWLKEDEQKGWVRRGKRGTQPVWIWSGHGDADYILDAEAM